MILIDVIGKLSAIGELEESCKDGSNQKRMKIELEDTE